MDGPPCLWLAPPVPVRQWVISVPKRLRGFLADRPAAVRALTKIFLAEIERLLVVNAFAESRECLRSSCRDQEISVSSFNNSSGVHMIGLASSA